jgi:pyruvate, orthophosphate dikinase
VCFDALEAEAWQDAGLKAILVRKETSPEDVKGMYVSEGVLTQLGGMTSHAAVVARGWGKPCITGCQSLQVDEHNQVRRMPWGQHPPCHTVCRKLVRLQAGV